MYSYYNVFLPSNPEELCKYIGDENIFKLVFKDVSFTKKYVSPLRKGDSRPGCFFWETQDSRIYFVDYGNAERTHLTSYDFIKAYYNFTPGETLTFLKDKFKHLVDGIPVEINREDEKLIVSQERKRIHIEPTHREWNLQDKNFWFQYGITRKQLEEDLVNAVKYFRITYPDGNFKTFLPYTPAYSYNLGNSSYKIYTPQDQIYKWVTNASKDIIGNIQNISGEGDLLIITKSYKDCRVLRNLGYKETVWFQSESQIPSVDLLLKLTKDYKQIVIFFDNDTVGITQGNKLKVFLNTLTGENKFFTTYIPLKYQTKDPSDFYKEFGVKKSTSLINKIIKDVTKKN